MKSAHAMPFGATLLADGATLFRLWAPAAPQVQLELHEGAKVTRQPMNSVADGWHELTLTGAGPGSRYKFLVTDSLAVPDPASRRNPDDVHGPSEVVDPRAHAWRDAAWQGRPWHEAVVYELHVGSFTVEGSFTAAAQRLPELAALGITAIELMPLADFPGLRGWGYDGVLHFAPDASYGTPDELKALVDTAHGLGLVVLLDVVYNHFGPEGNYLHAYCPEFFNARHHTPWGSAINFDGEASRTVRDFFVHNALYWVEEYHLDGLRLDAVHAIHDDSPLHIVCEIGRALRDGPGRERHVHLVLENDANQAVHLARDAAGRPLCATAQWNDDIHHVLHVLATGEADGYYGDYAAAPLRHLGRTLAQGFAYQGEPSPFRDDAPRGEPCAHLPATAFVSFIQNHDQVGNRAFGERMDRLAKPHRLAAAYACLLLSPQVPMLFMGEEYAAATPFLFFCDFGPDLAQAVSKGRREEFKRFAAFRDEAARARIPDPNAESSFTASKLRWSERSASPHREQLMRVQELLALRHQHLVPRLGGHPCAGSERADGDVLRVEWALGDGARWRLMAHFGDAPVQSSEVPAGHAVYSNGVAMAGERRWQLAPGAVLVTLEAAHA